MDVLDRLLEDHKIIRSSLAGIVGVLGEPGGIGWDDAGKIDIQWLGDAESHFLRTLREHEALEERLMAPAIEKLAEKGLISTQALKADHDALNDIFSLLTAVTNICDGKHIYQIRSVLSRLADDLEKHLIHEERSIFPMIKSLARGEPKAAA